MSLSEEFSFLSSRFVGWGAWGGGSFLGGLGHLDWTISEDSSAYQGSSMTWKHGCRAVSEVDPIFTSQGPRLQIPLKKVMANTRAP